MPLCGNPELLRRLKDIVPLPIRIRLSLSYFAIFSVAGVLLCCTAYFMAQRSLYVVLDHELDEHIDDIRDFMKEHVPNADFSGLQAAVVAEFRIKDEGKWLQIKDVQGGWVYRSPRILIAPHEVPGANTLPQKGRIGEFGAAPFRFRSLQRAFTVNGRTYVVEDGITLTKTDQTLRLFREELLLVSPLVFVLAGFAGHLVSRRALAPVSVIAREAQRINEGNLQRRLPQLETHDELAHLSSMLNEMLERIESGVRSVRDFTAYASHELRTPVALIRTEADLALQFERTNRDYREAIETINCEAQRMSSLLDGLLFLARADAGTEQVHHEVVDARMICVQASERWRTLFQRLGLQFYVDLPDRQVSVMGDASHLQRLLTVILENAGKYTPAGGWIRLSLAVLAGEAHFEVSDSGIGIPLNDQAYIFERFRRGSNTHEMMADGSGLGLSLAAWIAQMHQIAIEVDSTPGAGSRFSWTMQLICQPASPQCRSAELVREAPNHEIRRA